MRRALALAVLIAGCASAPIASPEQPLHRCEFTMYGGRQVFEEVDVVETDSESVTIVYSHRPPYKGKLLTRQVPAVRVRPCPGQEGAPVAPLSFGPPPGQQ